MICDNCQHDDVRCNDSRPTHVLGQNAVRRRRHCPECGVTFTTYEVPGLLIDKLVDRVRTEDNVRSALESALSQFNAATDQPITPSQEEE